MSSCVWSFVVSPPIDLFFSLSLSLSSVSAPSLISSSPLSWSSSSMWSEPLSTRTPAHTQNEEYCPVAIHNPLTVVVRRTHTTLDVLQEIQLDEYWNVQWWRATLSGPWTGFRPPCWIRLHFRDTCGPGRDWQRSKQRAHMARNLIKHAKETSAKRNTALGELRGIEFFDPENMELNETMTNEPMKLEACMDSAMPCKLRRPQGNHPSRRPKIHMRNVRGAHATEILSKDHTNTKRFTHVSAKLTNLPRMRTQETQNRDHEDHVALLKGGAILWVILILCTCLFLCWATKTPDAKSAVDKEWEKLKDDSGSNAELTEQGSSASRMTAATVLDVISRPPGMRRTSMWCCIGLHSSEYGTRSRVIGITRIRVPSHLDSSTTIPPPKIMGQNSSSTGTSWKKLFRTPIGRTVVGATLWKGLGGEWFGKCFKMGMFIHAPRKKLISLRQCGRKKTSEEKRTIWNPCGTETCVSRGTNTSDRSSILGMYAA